MLTSAYRSHRLLAYQPPATMAAATTAASAAAPPTNRTIHGSVPVPEPEGSPPVGGSPAGAALGVGVGDGVGVAVGSSVGVCVGSGEGVIVGDGDGVTVGSDVDDGVGDGVGVTQIARRTFSQPVIWSQLSVVHASPSSQSSDWPE